MLNFVDICQYLDVLVYRRHRVTFDNVKRRLGIDDAVHLLERVQKICVHLSPVNDAPRGLDALEFLDYLLEGAGVFLF